MPIPLAQHLATELGAEIYLARVVVVIDAFSGLRFDPDILRMIEDAKRYLAELESRFELPAERTMPIVPYGDNAAKELITIVENEGIDLIMMASRCKEWLQRLAQGSVCCDVVHSRVCPVCVYPWPARRPVVEAAELRRKRRPMRILIAVDGSAECEASLRLAARWVGVLDAHVYLLQVIDSFASARGYVQYEPEWEEGMEPKVLAMMKNARTYLDELAPRLELAAGRTVPLVRCGGNAAEKIITVAEDEHIDLVIMAGHCRSWLGELTRGSVCSEVIRSRVCPVLRVPLSPRSSAVNVGGVLARGG